MSFLDVLFARPTPDAEVVLTTTAGLELVLDVAGDEAGITVRGRTIREQNKKAPATSEEGRGL